MTADYKAMRKAARLPERTVPVCFRGDLVADFEVLERELEEARGAAGSDSLDAGTGELLDRMEALQAQMRESTFLVRLRGMPGPKYRALVAQHPARRDETGEVVKADEAMGINNETFWEPLIRACIVEPELTTAADWDEFVEGITDFQYGQIAQASFLLNRGDVSVPFSFAASTMRRTSADE